MMPSALMLGDPERIAFPGHLRLARVGERAGIAVAGRVGVGERDDAGLVAAYRAARALEAAVLTALDAVDAPDRHALLHTLWEAIAAVPPAELGPAAGDDLGLLAVAADAQGVGVAGVGLSGAWGLGPSGPVPLVPAGHPLLAPPGRPARTPGVLTLEGGPYQAVVGVPSHLEPVLPAPAELARRCGVRS